MALNTSGTVHSREIPDRIDVQSAITEMQTLKLSHPDLFEAADKKRVAMCKTSVKMDKGEFHVKECEWIEIKKKEIKTAVVIKGKLVQLSKESAVSSYTAVIGEASKTRLRNFITKCATCGASRYGSEIIKGDL